MKTSIIHDKTLMYPSTPPFNPDKLYPEFEDVSVLTEKFDQENRVYAAVRDILHYHGFDRDNFGSNEWNPFKELVKKGQIVVIKPNLVLHENSASSDTYLITHGSVIRPILDYIFLATIGDCEVIICDVPLQEADFEKIIDQSGIKDVVEHYRRNVKMNIVLMDLRKEKITLDSKNFVRKRVKLSGDPEGYKVIDLGEYSELEELCSRPNHNFSVSNYDYLEAGRHHYKGKHEYLISKTILNADVLINFPKLKTHQKTGVTISLKNLIGINGDKSWLPHYTIGSPSSGGDEFPDENKIVNFLHANFRRRFQAKSKILWSVVWFLWQISKKIFKITGSKKVNTIVDGAWSGNDTLWRTVLDLNKIIFFVDKKEGVLHHKQARKYLSVVDGIVSAEGNGPLFADKKKTGVIAIGEDPLVLDIVCANLMGLNWIKIRKLVEALKVSTYRFSAFRGDTEQIMIVLNGEKIDFNTLPNLDFIPPPGWEELKTGNLTK